MADSFTQRVEILDGGKPVAQNPDLPIIDVPATELGSTPASRGVNKWLIGGGVAAAAVVVGGLIVWRRKSGTDEDPSEGGADDGAEGKSDDDDSVIDTAVSLGKGWWNQVPGLPTEEEAPDFDLVNNWGKTPKAMRPLFALMEQVSRIRGSARIFALISYREAGFKPGAHNDSKQETKASSNAYRNAKDRNQPLAYGEASGEFGSGGLFGALAPYFLWTAVQEMKGAAPLLGAPPAVMFSPRIAAFGAVVYMQRLLTYYRIDDHADIKVGWARPSLLRGTRTGSLYKNVRTKFYADAAKLGLDLEDTTTIPKDLSAEDWPGAATAFTALTTIPVQDTAEG